jgi:methylenetetrahydrofolate dehydrogenase (NADP+)/methenyltetrahydrofolate cyclohydrolase
MSAQLLEGTPVASQILNNVTERVKVMRAAGIEPGLATVLVGDDPASIGYVRKKHEACAKVGIHSENVHLAANTSQSELDGVIQRLNVDKSIHGFILQHPLPSHLDFSRALLAMDPQKDADGLHPTSIGRLAVGLPGPIAATPAAVRAMLCYYRIPTSGRHVVVLGRGPTLGRPLALLLSGKGEGANAAVTILHSAVTNLSEHTQRADILVSGVGQPGVVTPDMVRQDAVVISAGLSWNGKRLQPDVDEAVAEKASWITPRLGGVGVMTVAMLLQNTVQLAEQQTLTT